MWVCILIVALFVNTACSEQPIRASDILYSHLNIERSKELADKNIRDALLDIVPLGSSVDEIFKKMTDVGIGPNACAPGEDDGSEFSSMPYCGVRSSEGTCGEGYVNFNIYFVVEKKKNMRDLFEPGATKLVDIKVGRWVRKCR